MLPIPENVLQQFNEVLKQRAVVESLQIHYRKWLRYFLDLEINAMYLVQKNPSIYPLFFRGRKLTRL